MPRSRVLLLLAVLALSGCASQRFSDLKTPVPLAERDFLIIGFVGGREPWDSKRDAVRRLAVRLEAEKLPGVHVATIINRRRDLALELVRRALDTDGNGALDERERARARVLLYGQSFGGAAVVKFARQLERENIPVLLTVQVDSVGKDDEVIPANVLAAANLYQDNAKLIKGEHTIRAADPGRTRIVGNFRFDYEKKQVSIAHVPWHKRVFRGDHTRMNEDPEVWALVERLLREAIEAAR